jgi:exodeoxyribonuclease VII, large subunit
MLWKIDLIFFCIDGNVAETLSVCQLNERVRSLLSSSPGVKDIWVAGEISNLVRHSSGHYYFTLKDDRSEIRCSLFKNARSRLTFEPKDNMKVNAFGHVDIYVQRGSYQLIVESMRTSGIGDLYLRYEELKKKLGQEGLFEQSRKRPLPEYPKCIGVVTSPTGAAIHDILTVSGRRFPSDILLYPALVQGDDAPASIVNGIKVLNEQNVDVLIVGRGGGSIEDLWAFNDESVARAISSSRAPVISAVGHETDFTISDYVADVRAATPSAAAELALPDKRQELQNIENMKLRLSRSLMSSVSEMRGKFSILDAKLSPKRAKDAVDRYTIQLNTDTMKLNNSLRAVMERYGRRFAVVDARLSPKQAKSQISQYLLRLDDLSTSADSMMERILTDRKRDVSELNMMLDGLNPRSVMERGYAMISDGSNTITDVSKMSAGDMIHIVMRNGSAEAEVKKVNK